MKTPLLTAAALLGLSWPATSHAIELSLEENKAERGNIGFVDTQRLFQLFPETRKAKENFEEAVRLAEDQINQRKAEILRLRKELDSLKVEREALARSTPTPVAAAPAVSTAAVEVPAVAALRPSTAAAALPLVINLPGATAGPVVIAPPASVLPVIAVAVSTPAVPAPVAVSSAAAPALPDALAVLDERIAQKTQELERKRAQAREEQEAAEKNLLDLESRKSEILLGKIYKAVQEVARREGISVVVDKTGILYGHNAVDLTEKVLKHLKGG
ncbi:MAG: OmpH family outer membrane protein [Elusimicrobia bacterium]|nr:OmpH family outer membrane protein [Elusimicrobiota bacterium]